MSVSDLECRLCDLEKNYTNLILNVGEKFTALLNAHNTLKQQFNELKESYDKTNMTTLNSDESNEIKPSDLGFFVNPSYKPHPTQFDEKTQMYYGADYYTTDANGKREKTFFPLIGYSSEIYEYLRKHPQTLIG